MKKLIATIGLTVVAAVMLAIMVPQSQAGAAVKLDAASISKDFGCLLFNGDGTALVFTDNSHSVVNDNGGNMWCKADVSPPSSGQAAHYGPFGCNTPAGFTTEGTQVVSASGKATLKCPVR